jgi:hypothetical protein
MAKDIPTIQPGTLIDQQVLSNIVTTVNAISGLQYSSNSSIGKTGETTKSTLKNGQWGTSTIFQRTSFSLKRGENSTSGEEKASFGITFLENPIVQATIYASGGQVNSDPILSSIVITEVTRDSCTFKIVCGPAANAISQTLGILITAIGRLPEESTTN